MTYIRNGVMCVVSESADRHVSECITVVPAEPSTLHCGSNSGSVPHELRGALSFPFAAAPMQRSKLWRPSSSRCREEGTPTTALSSKPGHPSLSLNTP